MVDDREFALLDARVEALDEQVRLMGSKIAALERVCDELLTYTIANDGGVEFDRLTDAQQALADSLTIRLP
jgi:pentose-5-phosphate-3-epimerase